MELGVVRSGCRTGRFFFFNDTATTEIYTLSLHDALPIADARAVGRLRPVGDAGARRDAHDVVESRRPQPVRAAGAPRPQPSERVSLVDGQRGRRGCDGARAAHS